MGECLQNLGDTRCPLGQFVGPNDQCIDNGVLCSEVSSIGVCEKCVDGYYLLFTNECVSKVICQNRQFIINNQCYDVSVTCGNYDR